MISVINANSEMIASYSILRYRLYGNAHEFVAILIFEDDSTLHIRDYVFLDGSRKYAFHWQDKKHALIRRCDNAEHHKHLSTFPFHVHTPSGVEKSAPMTLSKVLNYIKSSQE